MSAPTVPDIDLKIKGLWSELPLSSPSGSQPSQYCSVHRLGIRITGASYRYGIC